MPKHLLPSTIIFVGLLSTAAPAEAKVIGSETASGDYAVAVASGDVDDPSSLRVTVSASSKQKVDVNWSVVCTKGLGAGSKDGKASGKTTLVRSIKMPMSNPDNCVVSASAQLSKGGKLKVTLSAS
ncbi:MAG: hypothetical protein Q7T55_10285 [Solirubrobacteraceae bacterium]|nr:hypothetical protein [Solirubrobacteraceae bacterium]